MDDLKDLEVRAKDHKSCPDSANPAEVCFYWTMRSVYDSLSAKRISRDDAKHAKQMALSVHSTLSDKLKNALQAHKEREAAILAIGSLRSSLHKADTIEEKYAIALKALSAVTGETLTEQMELEWIKKARG